MVGGQSESFLFAPEILGKVEWTQNEEDLENYSDNIGYRVPSAVMLDMSHLSAHKGRLLRRNVRRRGAVQPCQAAAVAT